MSNIKALANEKTSLRKYNVKCLFICFPVCARRQHSSRKQNISEKVQKPFFLRKQTFLQKNVYVCVQSGKHSGQKCFRNLNDVYSFAGTFNLIASLLCPSLSSFNLIASLLCPSLSSFRPYNILESFRLEHQHEFEYEYDVPRAVASLSVADH